MGAVILGLIVSPICLTFCSGVKHALGYDDSLDAFGIHGVGGIVGAIGTGIVVSPALGGAGIVDYTTCAADGDILTCGAVAYSMVGQVFAQIKAVLVAILWSGIGSSAIFFLIRALTGGRVSHEIEIEGLDLREHGEAAYHA